MAKKKEETLSKELEIDKKKLVEEIKQEIKINLEDEILEIIDTNTKDKLDSMEKRIYKHKNISIRKRNIIILLLLIIIGIETKLLLDDFNINSILPINNNNTIQNNTTEEEKDLDWYIEEYSYLLDMVNTNLDNDNYSYLYDRSYNISNIDNNVKLNMAYLLVDSSNISSSNSVIMVSNKDLEDNYNKIFNDNNYIEENFNYQCLNFIYNENNDSYMAIDIECDINKEIKQEITNIYEEDNNIIIETILGIYNTIDNTLSDVEDNIISDNYNGENIVEYTNELNKYRYTFINDNNNYYFNSIEKIN